MELVVEGLETILVKKKARGKDKKVVKVVEEIKKAGAKILKEDKWKIKGELVLKKRKIYMPCYKMKCVDRLWLSELLKVDLIFIPPFHFLFYFLFHFRSIFYF